LGEKIKKKKLKKKIFFFLGFSQGGAVSLYMAYSKLKKPIKSVVGLSTYLPHMKKFPQLFNKELSSQKLFVINFFIFF
jgi:predicted esterase